MRITRIISHICEDFMGLVVAQQVLERRVQQPAQESDDEIRMPLLRGGGKLAMGPPPDHECIDDKPDNYKSREGCPKPKGNGDAVKTWSRVSCPRRKQFVYLFIHGQFSRDGFPYKAVLIYRATIGRVNSFVKTSSCHSLRKICEASNLNR